MRVIFTEEDWEDYLWFQETDKKLCFDQGNSKNAF